MEQDIYKMSLECFLVLQSKTVFKIINGDMYNEHKSQLKEISKKLNKFGQQNKVVLYHNPKPKINVWFYDNVSKCKENKWVKENRKISYNRIPNSLLILHSQGSVA